MTPWTKRNCEVFPKKMLEISLKWRTVLVIIDNVFSGVTPAVGLVWQKESPSIIKELAPDPISLYK